MESCDYKVCGRDSKRNLNRRDSTLWSSLVSVEKADDEISSTGGRRRLSPRPFGPEPKIWSVFTFITASFRNLPSVPVFAGFFRLFPGISAYFQTVLKWTFCVFTHFSRLTGSLQPIGLHPCGSECLAVWSLIWLAVWLKAHLHG